MYKYVFRLCPLFFGSIYDIFFCHAKLFDFHTNFPSFMLSLGLIILKEAFKILQLVFRFPHFPCFYGLMHLESILGKE